MISKIVRTNISSPVLRREFSAVMKIRSFMFDFCPVQVEV